MYRRIASTPIHGATNNVETKQRKRKKSSLSSHFQLTRPQAKPENNESSTTNDQDTKCVHKKLKISFAPDTNNAAKEKSMAYQMASCSTPTYLNMTTLQPKEPATSQQSQQPQSSAPLSEMPKHEALSVERLSHINPLKFVESCFKAYKVNAPVHDSLTKQNYFLAISEENLAAYKADVIRAIRQGDVETLRNMKNAGRSLQGCNRYGESLLHIACRRGSTDVLKFLLNEGECTLRVHDDFGRTPLHDACWQAEPNFNLIELILDAEPELLLLRDKRGFTALEYIRKEHWGLWIKYLAFRMKKEIRNRLTQEYNIASGTSTTESTTRVATSTTV